MSEAPVEKEATPHRFSNTKEVRQQVLAMAGNGETPAPTIQLTLSQKIGMISTGVKKIKMTGVNKDAGYKYLKIEDVVDAVRPGMEQYGLILTPQLEKIETVPDAKGILRDVLVRWTLEDTQTGDCFEYLVPGSGWDFHDKGTYKALTGSRKYALILIFNLPVGDNPEQNGPADREAAKGAQKAVAASKVAESAGRGFQTAIDAISQVVPESKIVISRPEEHNGNYIIVTGMIAVPQLERFFDDTGSKRFKTKTDLVPYWRVPAEYEKGLVLLCEKLKIEVEG
jgi:hypothetical protein